MRIRLLALTLLLASLTTHAQNDLSGSRQTSVYTYVYHLDPHQALFLYRNDMAGWDKMIRTPVDSFLTDTKRPDDYHLPPADYLFVLANGPRLKATLQTIGPLRYDLLSSGREAALSLHTPDGLPVTDDLINVRRHRITYDARTNSYPLGAWHNTRVVNIVDHGALYYFSIESGANFGYYPRRQWWMNPRTLIHTAYYRLRNRFRRKPNRSYFVFSKPKYKPADTVRFKAFIMTYKGRPVDKPLQVRLREVYPGDMDTVIGQIIPYRPGAYSFSFILTDNLKLTLDENYQVQLESPAGKAFAKEDFHYEDYSLTSLRLTARADKTVNSPGDPISLYVRAIDENDLPVPHARVRIWVGQSSSFSSFHRPAVFIPDTLWTHSEPLDPVGETRIILPDSIFPPASFQYTIHLALLNSDNEYKEKEFNEEYQDDTSRIFIDTQNDSIRIDYRVRNHSRPAIAVVRAANLNGDPVTRQSLDLPATIRVSPFASAYSVTIPVGPDSTTASWTCRDFHPTLSLTSGRTRDSVSLFVDNPQHLFFWYTIHAGSRILARGYTDSLSYRAAAVTPAPYSITLQYRWAGSIQKNDYPLPFRDRLLQIEVHQPNFVYPGEKTTIAIDVKDSRGRPVPDADLTAWSYTAKFNSPHFPGGIPYLGKQYHTPDHFTYTLPNTELPTVITDIDWRKWSHAMSLDTIEFYKFLNPAIFYINCEATAHHQTQLAPFVSHKGCPEPVHLLYIDERLVFFSGTGQYPSYDFPVEPGLHSLRLRTATSEIRLDSIRIAKGVKTFIGVNDDTANHAIHVRPMPDTLTANEQELLRHSLIGLQNTFDYKYVLLSQGGDRNYLFNTRPAYHPSAVFLAGPFSRESSLLRVEDNFRQLFDPEWGYRFTIGQDLIKEKEMSFSYALHARLDHDAATPGQLRDRPMTPAISDSLWQDNLDTRSQTIDFIRNQNLPAAGNGALQFSLSGSAIFVKKVFLFRYDYPDYMRVYAGQTRYLGYIEPGRYRLFLLLKSERYLSLDSIEVKPDGLNHYDIPSAHIHEADSFSHHIAILLKQQEDHWTYSNSEELEPMRSTFNDQYLHPSSFHRQVTGRVLDQAGQGIAGVTVLLKGTKYSTATNTGGYFQLFTTEGGALVFSAVGFNTQQIALKEPYTYEIHLQPSTTSLNDVVVIGFSVSRKMDLTGSVSTVTFNGLTGNAAGIQIRGNKTTPEAQPLIIVDGLPYSGKVADLDPNSIQSVSVLATKDAAAIYGSAGAGGVIIITTKKAAGQQPGAATQPGNTLRHRFRDDGWWQAALRTDKNGSVSFPVEFPDDITNWQTFVIAATDHRQTGFAEGNIRSFKSISAELSVPTFLVDGDSARIIGKILNYMPDTAVVTRTFSVDGLDITTGDYRLRTAHLDSFLIFPRLNSFLEHPFNSAITDTMRLRYTLRQVSGYFDGEERTIPIYPAGAKETVGNFSVLESDTSLHLYFDTTLGPVHLFASASILPVFLDEIQHLERYEYGCNEQLASKLKALLQKKQILTLLQKPFKEEKLIGELIEKLMNARKEGLWGWWPEDEPSAWITLHVAEALLAAEKAGYPSGLEKTSLTDYLVYRLENKTSRSDRLFILRLLQEMQAKIDFRRYIDTAEKQLDRLNTYETLRLIEIRQAAGLEIRLDTILSKRSFTALGSCYWGEDEGGLWDNPIQLTLLMYRLLRQAGGYDTLLPKIRNYFLEQRGPGYWRNTYESSLILQTLLPDLVKTGASLKPPSLYLTRTGIPGAILPSDVTTFPFETECPATSALEIHKEGSLPVYFTAWQQYWNNHPQKVDGVFSVHTSFESGNRLVTRLTAGEPAILRIDVNVKGDADYVMIEAPIPAGCTYQNKTQSFESQELHREYFKNKLSIFCGHLRKGNYRFQVSLMPRYTGVYLLNPARAELMYFPILFGREEMQSVHIE